MKKYDSTVRFVLLAIFAIIVSALVAHTQIAWLAIGSGFLFSFVISLLTKGDKKYWYSDTIACILGSQIGWAALFI